MITPEQSKSKALFSIPEIEMAAIACYLRFPVNYIRYPIPEDLFVFEPYKYIIRAYKEKGAALINASGAFGEGNDSEVMELADATYGDAGLPDMLQKLRECLSFRKAFSSARELCDSMDIGNFQGVSLDACGKIASAVAGDEGTTAFAASDAKPILINMQGPCDIFTSIPFLPVRKSELIIIGARPGCGKSTLMHQVADSLALSQPGVSMVFTMEMTREEWFHMTLRQIERKYIQPDSDKWPEAVEAVNLFYKNRRLIVDDKSGDSTQYIRSKAAEARAKFGSISSIFVDYLTIMEAKRLKQDNESSAIGAITKELKQIAKEFKCPVFAASQLTRIKTGIYGLEDLFKSDQAAQDANQVWIMTRDEDAPNTTEPSYIVHLARKKWRGGPMGEMDLDFYPRNATFTKHGEAGEI